MALNPNKTYDVVAINAASLSTQLAGLPFNGPIGGVRVALIGDQWVGFPDVDQLANATFDMVVAGRVLDDGDVAIMMVEAESTEETWALVGEGRTAPTEEVVAAGLEAAKPFLKALCDAQAELVAKLPVKETASFPIFLDYQDDVYAAGVRGGHRRALRRSCRSPTSSTARSPPRSSRTRSSPISPPSSRVARRRSAGPTGR